MADRPLAGAVALITGASSSTGAAAARQLAQKGAAVALVARHRDRLEHVADAITSLGGRAAVMPADLTRPDRAEQAVQDTLDWFGRLDILVSSAAIMVPAPALHAALPDWDQMISLNVSALLHLTHAAVPYLIDAAATSPRQVADIVNVSSAAGRVARPGSSVYTLTQFGLTGFTESLRRELLPEHVRVSVVEPGTTTTGRGADISGATRDAGRRQASGTGTVRAADVADAISYIVTREPRVAVSEILIRAGGQTW